MSTNLARSAYKSPTLFDQINNVLGWDLFGTGYAINDNSNLGIPSWKPKVNIKHESDRFLIMADIPGVDPKAIEISIEDNVLTLKGERALYEKNSKEYAQLEIPQGKFERQFTLPNTVDLEKIQASGDKGVLIIDIPKKENALHKKIIVKTEEIQT